MKKLMQASPSILFLVALVAMIALAATPSARAFQSIAIPCSAQPGCDYALVKVDGAICPPSTCQFITRWDDSASKPTWIVGNAGVTTYGDNCATLWGSGGFTCNNPPVTFSGNAWTGHWDNYLGHFSFWARKSCGNGLYRFSGVFGFDVSQSTYVYPTWVPVNITSTCRASI
jgi:hypothetical protein